MQLTLHNETNEETEFNLIFIERASNSTEANNSRFFIKIYKEIEDEYFFLT